MKKKSRPWGGLIGGTLGYDWWQVFHILTRALYGKKAIKIISKGDIWNSFLDFIWWYMQGKRKLKEFTKRCRNTKGYEECDIWFARRTGFLCFPNCKLFKKAR